MTLQGRGIEDKSVGKGEKVFGVCCFSVAFNDIFALVTSLFQQGNRLPSGGCRVAGGMEVKTPKEDPPHRMPGWLLSKWPEMQGTGRGCPVCPTWSHRRKPDQEPSESSSELLLAQG